MRVFYIGYIFLSVLLYSQLKLRSSTHIWITQSHPDGLYARNLSLKFYEKLKIEVDIQARL